MRHRRLISTGAACLLCGLAALATLALGAPKNPPNGPPADVPRGNGQVKIGLSKGSNVIDLPNAAIGDNTNDSVVVSNDGRLAADFQLAGDLVVPAGAQGATALADQLQLVVSQGTTQLYSGSVAGFNAAGAFALGTLYPTQGSRTPTSLTLNFDLSFPSTGDDADDNALQNLGPIDQQFRIDATQQSGAPSTRDNSNRAASGAGPSPKQKVAGETASGAAARTGAHAPNSGVKSENGSSANDSTSSATSGSDAGSAPETTHVPTAGAGGQPADKDDRRQNVLLLGLLGCAAALVLWWSIRTPGRVGA
jgi:hypothetical protein